MRHFDEPFADSSAIPTYIVSEFTARYVKVALSGDGGDEFFAGYPIRGAVEKYQFLDRVPRPLRKLMRWTANALPYSAYGKNFLACDRVADARWTGISTRTTCRISCASGC